MNYPVFTKNKYYLKDILSISEETLSVLDSFYSFGIKSGYHVNSLPVFLLPLFYTVGILVSLFLSLFFKGVSNVKDNKFVFITTFYTVIRCSKLKQIADENIFSIVYLPSFNFREAIRHIKYHKLNKTMNVSYPTFKLKTIFRIWYFSFRLLFKMNLIDVGKLNKNHKNYFYKLLFQQIAYESFYKSYFKKEKLKKEIKWLFDSDKSIFIPIVECFKKDNIITTHFQHGIFIKPNKFYFPLFCDNIICCSEREKSYYLSSGVDPSKIYVLGAPLQSVGLDDINAMGSTLVDKYDLLVLLSDTYSSVLYNEQIYLINLLTKNYSNYTILLRFRPASKMNDLKKLQSYIYSYDISKDHTLEEDINRSMSVISFSLDSIFKIQERQVPFIIINPSTEIDEFTKSYITTSRSNEYEVLIQDLVNRKSKRIPDAKFVELFGDYSIQNISNTFNQIIELI